MDYYEKYRPRMNELEAFNMVSHVRIYSSILLIIIMGQSICCCCCCMYKKESVYLRVCMRACMRVCVCRKTVWDDFLFLNYIRC